MPNDIEPIITNNFSIYIYLSISLVVAILTILLVLFFRYRKSKKVACKNPYGSLDFSNPTKELLYQFTVIAKEQNSSPKLEALLKELEPYKYSQNAKVIDEKVVAKIKEFISEGEGRRVKDEGLGIKDEGVRMMDEGQRVVK